MSAEILVAVWSAVVAMGATGVAVWTYREQSRQAAFELARSLHADLTSGDVARSRDVLGTYRRSGQDPRDEDELQDVLNAYFTLLWCFERVLAGRNALQRRPRWNPDLPAVQFLDSMMHWHVEEWATSLPEIRMSLDRGVRAFRDRELDDRHSLTSFDKLCRAVAVQMQRQAATGPST